MMVAREDKEGDELQGHVRIKGESQGKDLDKSLMKRKVKKGREGKEKVKRVWNVKESSALYYCIYNAVVLSKVSLVAACIFSALSKGISRVQQPVGSKQKGWVS